MIQHLIWKNYDVVNTCHEHQGIPLNQKWSQTQQPKTLGTRQWYSCLQLCNCCGKQHLNIYQGQKSLTKYQTVPKTVPRMTGWDVCSSTWKTTYIYLCNRGTYTFTLAVPSVVIKEPLANSSLSNENYFNADFTEFGKRLYKAKDIKFVVLTESNKAAILTSWKCKYKYSKLPRTAVKLSLLHVESLAHKS